MILEQLTVGGWRNLEAASLQPAVGLTVISGANAQGKTNVLEAMAAVITGTSHRALRDDELIATGEAKARLSARFRRPSGSFDQTLELVRAGRKSRQREGKRVVPGADPLGDPLVVLFCPEDLILVQSGPAGRRRFLDQEVAQATVGYSAAHRSYQRIWTQRNTALKRGEGRVVDALDLLWAQAATRLTRLRRQLVEALAPLAQEAYAAMAPFDPALTVTLAPGTPAEDPQVALAALRQRRAEEEARRISVLGPHRDDIQLAIGDNELRAFGSQGQQRTAAVALKLATVQLLQEAAGVRPLLLLDDVLSELDGRRRELLAQQVREGQTVLTTTDAEFLPERMQADSWWEIQSGKVAVHGTP
ncbi:MAG: DNA replication/repair protein RecF [Sulfobacillus sp.]